MDNNKNSQFQLREFSEPNLSASTAPVLGDPPTNPDPTVTTTATEEVATTENNGGGATVINPGQSDSAIDKAGIENINSATTKDKHYEHFKIAELANRWAVVLLLIAMSYYAIRMASSKATPAA